jgi:hypothetical protein
MAAADGAAIPAIVLWGYSYWVVETRVFLISASGWGRVMLI